MISIFVTLLISKILLSIGVFGGMIIDIDVKTPQPRVEVHGEIVHLVSDQEQTTFGIEDEQLKKTIANYMNDTEPNLVYIKKSQNTNGLYGKFNEWVDVKTTMKSRSINITKNCFHSGAYGSIKNNITIKTDWEITGKVTTEENTYHVYAKENITFKSAWEENSFIDDVFDTIYPSKEENKRGDISFVEAIKCDIVIRLEYEASLSGNVVADLSSKEVKKYHVQAYDVAELLAGAGLPSSIINTEIISISYYYKNEEVNGVDKYDYENYDDNEDYVEVDGSDYDRSI